MNIKGPDPVRNVYMLELIGTSFEVLEHSDPGLVGRHGIVVDETRGTIHLETNGNRCMIPKKNGRFQIEVKKGKEISKVLIDGNDILFRPVDRTKKCERKIPPSRNIDHG